MLQDKPVVILRSNKAKNLLCDGDFFTACLVNCHGLLEHLEGHKSHQSQRGERLQYQCCDTSSNALAMDNTSQGNDGHNYYLQTGYCYPAVIINFYLAWQCLNELARSDAFRESFYRLLSKYIRWKDEDKVIKIIISFPQVFFIDSIWSHRLNNLLYKRHILDEASAWLSTLGGGYSSLGDYFHHHAQTAGKISVQQWKLAIELGDKVLESKCMLFLSQSLMQQGRLRQAKHIIRQQFKVASCGCDDKLTQMCLAMWCRLKHLYSQRRVKGTV